MTFRHVFTLALAGALVTACNSSEDAEMAEDAAQPKPVLTQAPQPTTAPDGTALMTGGWRVNENAQGGTAMFGGEATEPDLTIDCEASTGTVTLRMARTADGPEAWRIDAGGEAARIDMTPKGGELPQITAEIDGGLAIFHAFSATGGIVSLTSPEGETMQFPTHPGISRVLDACS